MNFKRLSIALLVITVSIFIITSFAVAQDFPNKEITVVIPFDAGGNIDRLARMTAPYWEKELGVPVVCENIPGAQGQVGFETFSRRPADGYTIAVGTEPYLTATIIRGASYSYDDFKFINIQEFDPLTLVVNSDSKYNTAEALLQDIKEHPGEISYGVEPGGWDYIIAQKIKEQLNLDAREVFYEGGGPLRIALMGGHVDFIFDSVGGCISMGEKARVLAVDNTQGTKLWPDVPTLNEVLEKYDASVPAVGSIRFWMVRSELEKEYPQRYQILLETYEKAMNNENFIKELKEKGFYDVTQVMSPESANEMMVEVNKLVNEYKDMFIQ